MTHQDQHDVDQSDQAIEDVLHALRTAEPPQGYEARIHNALLQASMTTSRHSERSAAKSKDLLASLLPTMSWAAACAAVLIAGIAVRNYTHHAAPHTTPAIAHINAPSSRPAVVATETPEPTSTRRAQPATPKQEQTDTQPRRIEVALETHENIPEPPLPLTEQERLVLRMMRRNTAQQLAAYTPDARARQLHEDAKTYNDYFAEKTLDGQPIYHQQISGGSQ